jgi:hypothetical protein
LLEGIVESSIVLKKRKEKEKKKLQRAPSQEGDVQFFPCLHPKNTGQWFGLQSCSLCRICNKFTAGKLLLGGWRWLNSDASSSVKDMEDEVLVMPIAICLYGVCFQK